MTVKAVPDLAYLLSQDRWSRFFDINCTLVLATLKYMIWKILSDQPIKIITIRLIFHDFHFFFQSLFLLHFQFWISSIQQYFKWWIEFDWHGETPIFRKKIIIGRRPSYQLQNCNFIFRLCDFQTYRSHQVGKGFPTTFLEQMWKS